VSTWVLLRGLTREARHWGEFPAALAGGVEADAIVALDLPGCGARHAERSPADVPAIAEAARQTLFERGVPPPYRLIGLSLGGMVVVAWATAHPDDVLGAVLVNTSLRGFGAWHERLRPRHHLPLLAALIGGDAAALERTILRITSRHAHPDAASLLERWVGWRRERPVSRANAWRQLRAAARYRCATRPPVPLLVLASTQDELVDPECSRRMATAWHTAIAWHPTAGHDLPLDDPRWVVNEIATWLARAPSHDA